MQIEMFAKHLALLSLGCLGLSYPARWPLCCWCFFCRGLVYPQLANLFVYKIIFGWGGARQTTRLQNIVVILLLRRVPGSSMPRSRRAKKPADRNRREAASHNQAWPAEAFGKPRGHDCRVFGFAIGWIGGPGQGGTGEWIFKLFQPWCS
jgi:hypothetical protein